MKKRLVNIALCAVVLVMMMGLTACSDKGNKTSDSGVKAYTVEAKFNSEEINQWKSIYLLNEDTYVITVYAIDSQDSSKVTADFVMKGNYTLEGETLEIELGYGYTKALNGDTPIEMPVTPDNAAMYYAMIGGQSTTFTLGDGTFEIVQ